MLLKCPLLYIPPPKKKDNEHSKVSSNEKCGNKRGKKYAHDFLGYDFVRNFMHSNELHLQQRF
jgi:hypothetical protein